MAGEKEETGNKNYLSACLRSAKSILRVSLCTLFVPIVIACLDVCCSIWEANKSPAIYMQQQLIQIRHLLCI